MQTVEDAYTFTSAALEAVKEDPEVDTRSLVRRLGCSSIATKPLAIEKC